LTGGMREKKREKDQMRKNRSSIWEKESCGGLPAPEDKAKFPFLGERTLTRKGDETETGKRVNKRRRRESVK